MPQRKYRKRRNSSEEDEEETPQPAEDGTKKEDDEEEDTMKKLAEAKEMQKFRKRPVGVSAVGLAFGKKFTEEEKLAPDPFKMRTGGLVDMKEVDKSNPDKPEEDGLLQKLQSNFSAETKLKDDETHMMQYIEQEMTKVKGDEMEEESLSGYDAKIKALYQLPDRLKVESKAKKTEEMLSNQMLSGIPEVDLGVEAKFKNIEETEKARHNLLEEQKMKKKEKRSLAPANMATNFTLHSLRFYKRDKSKPAPAEDTAETSYIPVVGENEPELKLANTVDTHKRKVDHSQLATDDYAYDKFRKKTRHY